MANSSSTFRSNGTRIFHATANGTIAICRLVAFDTTTGKIIACPTAVRPVGVAPFAFSSGDAADYHRLGRCTVETDGTAAVGSYIKAAADGSGKGILDSSPGFTTAGIVRSLDATTNIADVELVI